MVMGEGFFFLLCSLDRKKNRGMKVFACNQQLGGLTDDLVKAAD